MLQELLAVVCDLDMPDSKGLTAAHYCAMNCEVDCLDILCQQVSTAAAAEWKHSICL